VLAGDEDADLIQYGREDQQGFPHQTTADQWYDEAQFESYRRLGQITAHSLIEKLEKVDRLKEINHHLRVGAPISSADVQKLFGIAVEIGRKKSQAKEKEAMSVRDKDEATQFEG